MPPWHGASLKQLYLYLLFVGFTANVYISCSAFPHSLTLNFQYTISIGSVKIYELQTSSLTPLTDCGRS